LEFLGLAETVGEEEVWYLWNVVIDYLSEPKNVVK
jgi:hypothetical protein